MKLSKLMLALPVLVVLSQSCVTKKKYEALEKNNKDLQNELSDVKVKYQTCEQSVAVANSQVTSLQQQLAAESTNLKTANDALKICLASSTVGNANVSKLVDEINASNRYIQQLVNAKNKSDSLNLVLTNNLTRSLDQSELKDVDVQVQKGVVYISLSDNMLYKSGGYDISPKAGETLSKIAKIIADYSTYSVLIEGNTDNVPISQKNIRNNWDLSSLRAASVVMALQTQYNVDPKRLTVGGRGEYNPVADNGTPDGKAKNRRTEIIITPNLDQFMDLIGKAPSGEAEQQK
jgi:chemotaxis protein MotB